MNDRLVREMLADHAQKPRNYGEISAPDAEGQATNPQCVGPTHPEGDQVRLHVVLSGDGTMVESVRFTGRGCTLSQASASLLSEQMIGTAVGDVREWDSEYIEERVQMELTPSRLHCAELVLTAFREATTAQNADTDRSR
ncbi:MAG: nitrogen fixation NifU-like protein [Natronomonas sp.]|jgi:nitrogen fixation NifU-like protein